MSRWYTQGTVSVTNGSATVTGVGTQFVANVKPGDEFRLTGWPGYEVDTVVSNTQLTLSRSFSGADQTGQEYEIIPTRGILQETYQKLDDLITLLNGTLNPAVEGRFPQGTVAQPGIRGDNDDNSGIRIGGDVIELITNAIARVVLSSAGLQVDVPVTGTAAQSATNDATVGRLLKVGAFGIGGQGVSYSGSLDDPALATGFYFVESAATGTKPSGFAFGHLIVQRQVGGLRSAQTFNINGRMFHRHYFGSWSAWKEVTMV